MKNKLYNLSLFLIYFIIICFVSCVVIAFTLYSFFFTEREFKSSELTFDADTKEITDDYYSIEVEVNDKGDLNYSSYRVKYEKDDDQLIAYIYIYGTYANKNVVLDGTFDIKVPLGDADKITFIGNGTKKTLWIKDREK